MMQDETGKAIGWEEWPNRPLTREELLTTADRTGLRIDVDILPLIIDLNEAGYKTSASCSGDSPNHFEAGPQRHGRKAWINFDNLTRGMLTEETLEELDSIIKDNTRTPYSLITFNAEVRKRRAKIRKDIAREEPEFLEELDRMMAEKEEQHVVSIEFKGPIS